MKWTVVPQGSPITLLWLLWLLAVTVEGSHHPNQHPHHHRELEGDDLQLSLTMTHPLSSPKKPHCYNHFHDISQYAVDIDLQVGYEPSPGYFSRTSNLSNYVQTACPVENLMHNCYAGKPQTAQMLENVRNVIKQTKHCHFESFEPLEFLYRIRNRHVLLVGDSMTMQVWIMLVCSLHGVTEIDYSGIQWFDYLPWTLRDIRFRRGDRTCPFPNLVNCYTINSTIHYPTYNASISVLLTHLSGRHGEHTIDELSDMFHLQRKDIIMFNYGVHFGVEEEYVNMMTKFKENYETTKKNNENTPIVMFRETTPQHFAGSPSGYFNNIKKCAVVNSEEQYKNDFRNRVAERLLQGVMPIIRIANATSIDPYAHIQVEFYRSYFAVDCTHYCMPSNPMYIIRDIIHNVFHVLLGKTDLREATLKND